MKRTEVLLTTLFFILFCAIQAPGALAQCTPSLTVDPNNTLCSGSPLQLTATVNLPTGCIFNGGSPFLWSGPGTPFSTASNTISLGFASAGNYSVSVNIADDGTNTCPCTFGAFGTAIVGPSNIITVNPTPPAPSLPFVPAICEGETATITAAYGGFTTGTFEWFSDAAGNNQIATGNPFVSPPLFFSANFYAREVTSDGCAGPLDATFQGVSALPADPVAGPDTICPGSDATLTATSTTAGGTLNWYDAPLGGASLGTGGSFNTGNLFQTTIFYVDVTAPNGCVSERTAVEAFVLPLIAAPVAPDIFICAGELGEIVATGTGTAGNTFLWYDVPVAGSPIQTAPMPTLPASPNDTLIVGPFLPGSVIFYVSELDATTGCETQRTPVTVFVNARVPEPQADDVEICEGDSVTLRAEYGVGSNRGDFYWWTDSLAGTLLQIGQNYTPPASLIGTPGTYDFWVEEQLNGCASPTRDRVTVTVFPKPGTPTVISDTICSGDNAFLFAFSSTPGFIVEWYTDGALQNIISFGPFFSTPSLNQNTTYYLRERNPLTGCTGDVLPVTVFVFDNPPAPGASNVTACENEDVIITATSSGDFFARLDLFNAAGSFVQSSTVGANSFSFNVGTLGQGTYTFFIEETETISGCTGPRTAITVTVNSIPANPTASGVSICSGDVATLNATPGGATNGTFNWYSDAALTNLVATGSAYTTPALTTNTTYYVTETANNCEGLATSVLVTVNALPAGPLATNDTICAGETAILTATASAGGILNWYDNASGITVLATGTSFTTPTLTQNTTFYVQEVIVGNACSSSIIPVNAVVNQLPPTPAANSLTACSNAPVSILAAGSGGANSRLDLFDNTNTLVQSGTVGQVNASFNLGTLAAGTYDYFVVELNTATTCQSAAQAVTVTVSDPPTAPVAAPVTICDGETASLTASSSGGTSGTFNWYSDVALTNLVFTGSNFITTALSANTTYYVTETNNGCEGAATPVLVTVNAAPVAPTATADTVCTGQAATLTASGSGGQLNWYASAAGNTIIFTGNSYTTPNLNQNTTYWVQEVAIGTACTSSLVAVTAVVNPLPSAPTAADLNICVTDPAIIQAAGSGSANGRIDLYDVATGGVAVQTGSGAGSVSFNLGLLGPGTVIYYLEEVDLTTGCTSSRTAVSITVSPAPANPTFSGNTTLCAGESTTLTAASAGGTNGVFTWYADAALTNLLATGSSYTTGSLNASMTYYVTETLGGCESNPTQVVVTVNQPPADPILTADTVCSGQAATLTAVGSGGQLNWYATAAANTIIFTGNSFTTSALTQNTTYWVQEVGVGTGCASNVVAVTAGVNPLPAAPAAAAVTFCATDQVVITATGSGNANTRLDLYALPTGGAIVQSGAVASAQTSFNLGLLPVGSYVYYVEEVDLSTGCVSGRVSVNATVDPVPTAPTLSGTNSICDGDVTILTATSTSGGNGTFNWYADAALSNLLLTGSSFNTGALNASTAYFVTEIVGNCESPSASITVTVNPLASAPAITTDTVCSGQPATLVAIGAVGNSINWYGDAAGNNLLFTGPTLVTAALTQSTTFYVEQVNTGTACSSGLIPVTALVNPLPAAPAATDVTFCATDQVVITATGTGNANTRLDLYDLPTGGAIVQSGAVASAQTSFNLGILPVGSYVYYIEEIDLSTGCVSGRVSVNVTVDAVPAAPSLSGTNSICAGDATTLTATSTGGGNGTFNWYADAGLSNLLFTGSSFNTGTLNASTTYFVTETVGNCESPSASITVTVNPLAAAPAVTADTVCAGQSATLVATGAAGSSINWYADAAGNNLLFTGPTLVTAALTQTTTFYVEQVNTGTACSSGLVAVTAVVNPLPSAPTAADLNICVTDPAIIQASGSGSANGRIDLYDVATGGVAVQTGAGASSISFNLGLLGPGTVIYYLEEVDLTTGCTSSRTAVSITVSPAPANPTFSGNTTLCAGESTTLTAASAGGTNGIFTWYADAALTNLLATGSSYTTGSLNASMTYYVTETLGGCESNPTQVVVTVNQPPADPILTADTVCSGQAATLTAVGSGGQLNWYATASANTIIFTGDSFTTQALTQNTTYWVQEVGVGTGCVSNVVAVTAVVNPNPPTPSTADVTFCATDQVVIAATGTGNANTRLDLYDLPTGGAIVQSGAVASAQTSFNLGLLPVGSYVYYIEEIDLSTGCVSGRVSVNVTVDAVPAAPSLSGTNSICAGDATTLTATSTGGGNGTFNWYADAGLSNLLFTGSSFNTGTLNASTTYFVTETVGNCESPSASITVTVNPLAAAPAVTADTVCAGQSATLVATGAAGNSINWYADAAGNNLLFTGPTLVTAALTQTTTFYVEQVNTGTACSSGLVAVTAVVNPLPSAPTAADLNICVTDPAIIQAAGSGSANGRIDLYDVATGGVAVQTGSGAGSVSFNLGLLGPGTVIYYLEEVDLTTGCTSSRTAVSITVSPAPANPTFSGNTTLCAGESTTLTAASAGGTNGVFTWYADAALTNLLATGSSYTTGSLNASMTYYVTETLGGCESNPTQVVVTVNQPPADPILTADTVCSGQAATLTAVGSGGQLNWYATASANTIIFTGNSFTTQALTQNTTYWVQEVGVGTGCVSNVVAVTAVVNPNPPTPSTADVTFCATDQVVIAATGTGNANTRLDLYDLPTGGAIVQSGAVASAQTSFNLGILPVGSYVYYIEEIDLSTGCVSGRVSVNVTVDAVPAAPSLSGTNSICAGDATTLTATSTGGGNGTFNWYADAGLSNLLFTGSSFNTGTLNASTTYFVTETVGNCESPSASITVTVNPLAAAPAVTADTVCAGQSATLVATGAAGSSINWYADAAGNNLLFTGPTLVTAALTQTTTFYVEQVNTGTACSSGLVAVTAVVNPLPSAPTAADLNICVTDPAIIQASGSGSANGRIDLYDVATGGVAVQTGAGASSISFNLGLLGPGTVIYYLEEVDLTTGCTSSRTAVSVTVSPAPANPTFSGNTTLCAGESTTLTAASAGGTNGVFTWYADAALTNLLATGSSYTTGSLNASMTYYVTETLGGCESNPTQVVVTVNQPPADPILTADTVCSGQAATLTAVGSGGQLNWYATASANTIIFTGNSFTTQALTQNTTYWVQEVGIGTGCVSNVVAVTAVVNPNPPTPSTADVTFCATDQVVIAATGTGNANTRLDLYDLPTGGAIVQSGVVASAQTSFNLGLLPVGSYVYYIEEIDLSTGCVSGRVSVNLTVNAVPAAPSLSGTNSICAGDATTLTATSTGGGNGTFNWYADAGLSNLLFTGSSFNTGTLNASTTYFVTETVGNCESPSASITVTVNPLAAAPAVTADTVCAGQSATLVATGAAGNSINWYADAAGNNLLFTGPTLVTAALTQTTTFYVEQVNTGTACSSGLVAVTAVVNPLPSAPTAADLNICVTDPAIIQASGSGSANGRIDLYDVATGGVAVQTGSGAGSVSFNLGLLGPGTVIYYLEEVDLTTGCTSSRTAVSITVSPAPANPTFSGNTTLCAGESTTLTAASAGGTNGIFTWYADAALTNLLITGSSYTTGSLNASMTYYVTETLGDCESNPTQVVVTVNQPPADPILTADTVCSGQAATLTAVGSGGQLNWYATASANTIIFTGNSFTTQALTQNTTYWVQEVGVGTGCVSNVVAVTAVVNPNPPTPSTADVTFCATDQVVIAATGTGNANTRLDLYDLPTGGAIVQSGAVASAQTSFNLGILPVGSYVYYIEEIDLSTGCVSGRVSVNVTVDAVPAAPSLSGTNSICAGDATTLTATSTGGGNGTFNWYADAGLSNLLFTGSSFNTGTLNASTTYFVTETVGNCESPSASITVTVNPLAAAPAVTADTVCAGQSATLVATGAAGNSINWYADAAGNNLLFTGPTLVTAALTQTTTFYVEQVNTGTACSSGLVAVTAVVNPLPSAPTAADLNICVTDPAIIQASGSGNANGRIDLYDVATGGVAVQTGSGAGSVSFNLGLLGPGTVIYYFEEVDLTTGCTSSRTAVSITVSPAPANPTFSGNTTLCAGESTTLTAASAGGTNGVFTWYADAALTNLLATGSSYTTGSLNASMTYYVTETLGGCESNPTQVVVAVNQPPADPILTADTVCSGQAATLTAVGSGGQLNWYATASANTIIFTGNSFTTQALTQNTTYWVQEVGVGTGCVSNVVAVTAVVNPNPPTPSTADVTFCATDQVVIAATGTGNANTRLDLYDLPTGGAIVQSGAVASAQTSFNLGLLPVGSYVYYIEEIDLSTGCVGGRVSVNVTVDAVPAAPSLSGTNSICAGDATTLTATSTGGGNGTFNWYADAGLSNLLFTGSSFNTGTLNASTTYFVTETVGNCESPSASITVTVNPLAAAPAVTADTVCAGQSATLVATGTAGNSINWYADAAGNNLLFTGPTLVTAALTQTTTFYVEQVNTGTACSSGLVAVTAVVNPLPSAPTAADLNICVTDPAIIQASGSGNANGRIDLYDVATGGVAVQTGSGAGSVSFNLGLLGPGTVIYYLEEVDLTTGCTSSRTAVSITVSPAPANPTFSGNTTLCAGESTTLTAASAGGTNGVFTWYADAALTNLLATGSSYTTGSLNASMTYYVTETLGGCESNPTQVVVTVNQPPADPILTADTVCSGQAATLTAVGSGGQLNWYATASANTIIFTGNSFTTQALTQNTTYWVQEVGVGTGCVSNVVAVTAVVNPNPPTPSTADVTFCATDQVVIAATGTGNANTRLDLYDLPTGGAIVQSGVVASAQTSFNLGLLPVGSYVYYIEEIDLSTGCVSGRVSVNVTVDPIPAIPAVGGNTTLCAGEITTLSATSGGGTAGVFNWYADAALTNLLATGSSYTTASITASTSLYVTETVGNCEGQAAVVVITVNPLPPAPVVIGDTICEGNTATLTAAATAGNTLNWYADANRTTLLFTGQVYTTPVLNQTITYWVEQVVIGTGCASPLSAVSVVVNPAPPAPSANNVTACTNQTITILASGTGSPNTRIDLYVLPAGGLPVQTGSGGVATQSFSLGLLGPGTFVYYIEEIDLNTGCTSARTSVTVTVDPIPANPIAASAVICTGQSVTLTAASGGGTTGTFNWYSDPSLTTLVFTGNTFTTPVLNSSINYYVTETVGSCEGGATQVSVTVNPLPSDPIGVNDTVCVGQTATLVAAGTAGGTLNWFDNANGNTPIATGPSFTTPILSQTTTYWVQQTTVGTGCESNLIPVIAVVVPAPAAPSASAVTACASEDVIIVASGSGNALTRIRLYDVATGGIPLLNGLIATTPMNFNIGLLAVGTYTYYIEEEDLSTGCVSPRVAVTITVDPAPANPNVSGTLTICEGESTTLTATSSTGTSGSFNWYADSTLTNLLFSGSSLTITPTITTDYWVAELVGNCLSIPAKVTVTVNPKPANPVVVPATVCAGQSATLIAAGTPGNNINWYNNASANTLLFTGNAFNTPAISQNTTFWVNQQDPTTGCESDLVAVNVTVLPLPAPPSASDITICEGSVGILTATGSGSGSLRWYNTPGATTPVRIDGMPPATANFSVGPFAPGTFVFYVDEFDGTCASTRTAMNVNVLPVPSAPVVPPVTVCEGQAATLNANFGGTTRGDFRWYDASGNVLLFVGRTYTTTALTGSTTFIVTEKDSICESSPTTVTVIVDPTPAAPITVGDSTCEGQTATLAAAGATGNFINWYTDPNGINLVFTGNIFTTPQLNQTTTYYVRQVVVGSGCESPLAPVTAVVNPLPPAPTATTLMLCEGEIGQITASGTGNANTILNWYDDPVFTVPIQVSPMPPSSSSLTVGPFVPGIYTYYIEEENAVTGCRSRRSAVSVVVSAKPAQPSINDTSICEGNSVTLTAPGVGTFRWYDAPAGGNLIHVGLSFTTPVLTQTTTYYVSLDVNGCESDRETVVVTVNGLPMAPSVSSNSPLCEGDTLFLTASFVPNVVYSWTGPNGFTSNDQNPIVPNVTQGFNQGVYSLVVTDIGSGCPSQVSSTLVLINPRPATPTVQTNSPVCAGDNLTLTVGAVPGATYNWTGPGGFISSTTQPILVVSNTTSADSGQYSVTISLNGCESLEGITNVVIDPVPTAPTADNDGPYCVGEDAQLTASGGIGGQYSWTGPNGFSSNLQNPLISNVQLIDGGIYEVRYISASGCPSPQAGTTTLTVNPPPPSIIIFANTPISEGDDLELSAPFVPNVIYNWSGPAGFTSNEQNPIITNVNEADNQGDYSLVITDTITGCSSEPLVLFVDIEPGIGSISIFVDNDGPACPGDTVQLLVSIIPGAIYSWSGPNGFQSNDQNPILTNVSNADAGVYTVNVTLPNGLTGSGSTTVSVGNGLDVNAGDDITIQVGQDAQLNAIGGITFAWSPPTFLNFPNIANPIVQNPPIGEFTYFVDAIDLNGCTGSDTVVVTVVETLPPVTPDELVVYDLFTPNNDGKNDFFVISGIERLQNYTLTVFNRGGAEVFTTTSYQNDWDGTYRGRELPEGTYYYVILVGDQAIKGPVTIIR